MQCDACKECRVMRVECAHNSSFVDEVCGVLQSRTRVQFLNVTREQRVAALWYRNLTFVTKLKF